MTYSEGLKIGLGINYKSSGVTLTPNDAESPEGYNNATKFDGGLNDIADTYTGYTASTTNTFSAFLKAGTCDIAKMKHTATGSTAEITINLTSGTITNTTGAQYLDSSIVDYGNGWYRASITFTSGTTAYITRVQLGEAGYIHMYGWQIERGASYATSYIPTYGSSVTRNRDLGDWVNNQIDTPILFGLNDDFTLYFNGQSIGDEIERTRFMLIGGGYTGSGNDHKNRFWISESNKLRLDGDGGVSMGSATLSSDLPEQTDFKVLARKNGSTIDFFLNGQKQTTTQGTNSAFAVRTLFGSFNNFYVAYGKHKQILIFPTALTDQEAIDLTTI